MGSLTSFLKDVYPYEYLDSFDKFHEPLAPKEAYYPSLDQTSITDEDYRDAVSTMNQLNLKTLGDLHDHYVKKDVLLLYSYVMCSRNSVTSVSVITGWIQLTIIRLQVWLMTPA